VAKLLLILILGGALLDGLSRSPEPPLLIDAPQASAPLDAAD
jgi:hypothetical protein